MSTNANEEMKKETTLKKEENELIPTNYDQKRLYESRRRYRNFRFSISMADFTNRKEHLMSTWEKATLFMIGQEEMSSSGHRHVEIFCTMNNSMTYGSARRQLDVPYVSGVPEEEIDAAIRYVSKDDTRVEGGVRIYLGQRKYVTLESVWPSVLQSDSAKEAMNLIMSSKPELFFLKRKQLAESFESEFGHKTVSNHKVFTQQPINVWDEFTHIFIGPTGIGKTNFALHHFTKAVHITNMQNFGGVSDDANITDGIVIDDIELSKLSAHKLLQLVDKEYEHGVDVKYGYGYIPAMLPRIICLNSMEYFWPRECPQLMRQAITRRVKVHYFTSKLFNDNEESKLKLSELKSKYTPHPDLNIIVSSLPSTSGMSSAPIQRKRKQSLGDSNWISKKMLLEKRDAELPTPNAVEVASPIVDPEMVDKSQIDIYHEAQKIGMKEPLPEQYDSFMRWLEMRKKREIAQYIDLTQFSDSPQKKVVVDLDDSDNDL